MAKKLEEIELTIEDLEKDGVFAVSLVEFPAIEENFIALSTEGVGIELKVVDEERRIVVGYALIPDKRIYRKMKVGEETKEFNIYFNKETIALSQELYMKNLNLNNVTAEHEKPVQGCSVIESWITESEKHDKINLYNVKPILGGWAIMMKIYNDEEWEQVKEGNYKGFSIEGIYQGFEKLQASKQEAQSPTHEEIIQQLKDIVNNGRS